MASKPVRFSRHALEQAAERGATEAEVLEVIRAGEKETAKHGRQGYHGRIVGIEVLDAARYAFNSGRERRVVVENLVAVTG